MARNSILHRAKRRHRLPASEQSIGGIRVRTKVRLLLAAMTLFASQSFGQIDLSGEWSNLTHEDVNHRQSVEIGDYTGLPINEAARLKAESWDEAVLATHE